MSSNLVKFVRDPRTGELIALPAKQVLLNNTNPGFGRTTSSGMRPQSASSAMGELYSRLPDADIAGARGPGVVPGGEQGKGARRGQANQEEQPPPPATYRPLGGAKQNYRGHAVILSPPDVGLGSTVAFEGSLVATPRDAGDDAEVITISLGLALANADDTADITDFLDPVCLLDWGIGGASFAAELDWMDGLIFSIPASFVKVGCVYNAGQIGVTPVPPLLFSAALAYGPQPKNVVNQTRRTITLGNLAAGAQTGFLRVPPYATGFSLYTRGVPNLLVGLFDQTTGAVAARANFEYIDRTNDANLQPYMFPLLNSTRAIRITNQAALIESEVTLVWNLAL